MIGNEEKREIIRDSIVSGESGQYLKEALKDHAVYLQFREGKREEDDDDGEGIIDDESFNKWIVGREGNPGAWDIVANANEFYEFIAVNPETEEVTVDGDKMAYYALREGRWLLEDYELSID